MLRFHSVNNRSDAFEVAVTAAVEFNTAYNVKLDERRQKQREAREQERKQKQAERQREAAVIADDKNIYTICGVSFPHAVHPYHYRTEDTTLKIGDKVLVPVGDKEAEGTIISIGQYMRQAAPFPIDKMKTIISKHMQEEQENG